MIGGVLEVVKVDVDESALLVAPIVVLAVVMEHVRVDVMVHAKGLVLVRREDIINV